MNFLRKRKKSKPTVNQLLAQIHELQDKVNSLNSVQVRRLSGGVRLSGFRVYFFFFFTRVLKFFFFGLNCCTISDNIS